MRIGIDDGTLADGTIDRVVEHARSAETQGVGRHRVSQIFGTPWCVAFLHGDGEEVRECFARRGLVIVVWSLVAGMLCSL